MEVTKENKMITKETVIELWDCIQAHAALKRIEKTLVKHDVNDYIIFLRTTHNSFLHGVNSRSDVLSQLAHLITNAASDLGVSPRQLAKDVEMKVYDIDTLRLELEELLDKQSELSQEEFKEQMREIYKKHEVTKEKIDEMMKEF